MGRIPHAGGQPGINRFQFRNPTNILYFRHPDESRGPDFEHGQSLKAWVPAFAGMTELVTRARLRN